MKVLETERLILRHLTVIVKLSDDGESVNLFAADI
jgi:hypothetical protein